jgi:hypothetical protein
MAHESQTARRKSRMAFVTKFPRTSEDEIKFRWFEFNAPETQFTPPHKPTAHMDEFISAFKNTSEYTTLISEKQEHVKSELTASYSVIINKVETPPQSIAAAVDTLIDQIGEEGNHLSSSLTADDYQRLTATRDRLIDVVGEDGNNLLRPLLIFIDNLIKNYDGESNLPIRRHYRLTRRPEQVGRPANRPRVKLADLLPQKIENIEDNEDVNTSSYKPHRPEHVGRPANRPRVKLTDLLLKEAEHIAAREVDTEMPVDNEE